MFFFSCVFCTTLSLSIRLISCGAQDRPSVPHWRSRCIQSSSLCKQLPLLCTPVKMFINTSDTQCCGIKQQVHQWVTAELSGKASRLFETFAVSSQSGKHTLSSSFLFLVFRLLWWLFGWWLMWTTLSDHADKCSRHQIKKLLFFFLSLFQVYIDTAAKMIQSKKESKSSRAKKRAKSFIYFLKASIAVCEPVSLLT